MSVQFCTYEIAGERSSEEVTIRPQFRTRRAGSWKTYRHEAPLKSRRYTPRPLALSRIVKLAHRKGGGFSQTGIRYCEVGCASVILRTTVTSYLAR